MATKAVAIRNPRVVVVRSKAKRRAKQITLPIAIIGGFVPFIAHTYRNFKNNGAEMALTYFAKPFIPFDPMTGKFAPDKLSFGLYPVIGGLLVHWLVGGKLGVNRALAKSRVPFIRL